MNELVREIEEDIRRERADELWRRYGRMMVMASVAIVLATVIVVLVQNHRRTVDMLQTAQFIGGVNKLEAQDYKGAIAAFDALSQDPSSTYYGLAMLRKANAQDVSGDHAAASKTYEALAARDKEFGGLAKLLVPSAPGAVAEPDAASPFYDSQRESKAWQLVAAGKKAEAAQLFTALRDDDNVSYSLRARAAAAVQYLAPEPAAGTKGAS